MPRHSQDQGRDSSDPESWKRCETCGEIPENTLRAHYQKVHQPRCSVTYAHSKKGYVKRHKDGTWHCPHCRATFSGYPTGLQEHIRSHHFDAKSESASSGDTKRKSERKEDVWQSCADALLAFSHEDLPPLEVDDEAAEEGPNRARLASTIVTCLSSPTASRQDSARSASKATTRPSHNGSTDMNSDGFSTSTVPRTKFRPRIPALFTPPPSEGSGPSTSPSELSSSQPLPPVSNPVYPVYPCKQPPLPSALTSFIDSLRVPLHHLGDIFVDYGFDTDETLDLLCQLAPEDGWSQMKDDILRRGKLAGWLAVQIGLKERAKKLHAPTSTS